MSYRRCGSTNGKLTTFVLLTPLSGSVKHDVLKAQADGSCPQDVPAVLNPQTEGEVLFPCVSTNLADANILAGELTAHLFVQRSCLLLTWFRASLWSRGSKGSGCHRTCSME